MPEPTTIPPSRTSYGLVVVLTWMTAAFAAVATLGVIAWLILPRMAPRQVISYSPWWQPVLRAQASVAEPTAAQCGDFQSRMKERSPTALLPSLSRALNDRDRRMRLTAVYALAFLRLPEASDLLLRSLADVDDEVRWRSASALGDYLRLWQASNAHEPEREERILAAYLHCLSDRERYVREEAADGLAMHHVAAAIEPLKRIVGDPSADNDVSAVFALGRIAGNAGVDVLVAALTHPSPRMRAAAARELGEIGDKRAVDPLRQVAFDSENDVRVAVGEALAQLGSPGYQLPAEQLSP